MPVMFGKERAHAEHHRLRSIQSQSGGFRSASTQGTLACPGIYLFLWGPQTKRDKTSIYWFMTNLVRLAARDARAAEASASSGCMSDHGVARAAAAPQPCATCPGTGIPDMVLLPDLSPRVLRGADEGTADSIGMIHGTIPQMKRMYSPLPGVGRTRRKFDNAVTNEHRGK